MDEIEQVVNKFNDAWQAGNSDEILDLLHENVVFFTPDLKTELIGRDKCIDSLKSFMSHAVTHQFEVKLQNVFTSGDKATVFLKYWVDYTYDDKNYQEDGREWWLLAKVDGFWKIISRALVNPTAN